MTKVVLIERHPILLRGLHQVLAGIDPAWDVVGVDILDLTDPQIYSGSQLVILSLPNEAQAAQACLSIVQRVIRPSRILILCDVVDGIYPEIPPHDNIVGYISKAAPIDLLESAIRMAQAGGQCFPARQVRDPLTPDVELAEPVMSLNDGEVDTADADLLSITPRQYEVLVLLARGYPIKTVSRMLNISVATAKTHAYTLYRRLNVKNKSEAVYEALRRGATLDWMPPTPPAAQARTPLRRATDREVVVPIHDIDGRQNALF